MRSFNAVFAASLAVSFAMPIQAHAWGNLGHETIAGIAEKLIAQDPKTKQAVQDILGVEPLAIAATWPDEVRNDQRFDGFKHYHFITYGDDNKPIHKEKDGIAVLTKYPDVLTNPSVSREEKMIALRYIVHMVGDVHQPLHVNNTYDIGGNVCKVVWKLDNFAKNTNLHSLWDTELVNYVMNALRKARTGAPADDFFDYKDMAEELMKKHKDLLKQKVSVDWQVWTDQSWKLSNEIAYPEVVKDPKDRAYCVPRESRNAGNQDSGKNPPVLGRDFADERAPVVERQLVLGGMRLAAFLKTILKGNKAIGPNEKAIIDGLMKTNDSH